MAHVVKLVCRPIQGHSVGAVYVNGKGVRTAVPLDEPDCERMATLISVERLLSMGSKLPLPPSVKGSLWVVQQILAAKHKAMLTGKKTSPQLEQILVTAHSSPNRVVRAAAAAASEFLK